MSRATPRCALGRADRRRPPSPGRWRRPGRPGRGAPRARRPGEARRPRGRARSPLPQAPSSMPASADKPPRARRSWDRSGIAPARSPRAPAQLGRLPARGPRPRRSQARTSGSTVGSKAPLASSPTTRGPPRAAPADLRAERDRSRRAAPAFKRSSGPPGCQVVRAVLDARDLADGGLAGLERRGAVRRPRHGARAPCPWRPAAARPPPRPAAPAGRTTVKTETQSQQARRENGGAVAPACASAARKDARAAGAPRPDRAGGRERPRA